MGNGHYEISKVEYMSVWAFKQKHNIPNNPDKAKQTEINAKEGRELKAKYLETHTTTPDFSMYTNIIVYKVLDLEDHYGF